MIFDKSNIYINKNFTTKAELFDFLANEAIKRGIAKDKNIVSNAFAKREAEGTTGFEDGFAIPHARVDGIDKPSIFVIRNKNNFSDWEALDTNGVKYAIALLIPGNAGSLHMDILSSIATNLIEASFRDTIKNGTKDEIATAFNSTLDKVMKNNKQEKVKIDKSKKLLIGISACPAGIAHTFMAKKAMEDAAAKKGYAVKWETQGANGTKNALSKQDIENASTIVIASDIELDLSRFKGKKVLITNTNDAIKNGIKLIDRANSDAKVFEGQVMHNGLLKSIFRPLRNAFQSNFDKPWTYLGITASMVAILALIGFSWYGKDWTNDGFNKNPNLFKIQEIAKISLYLAMPFTAAWVTKTITKRGEAFAIVFIATMLMNMPTMAVHWNAITGFNNTNVINIFYDWNGFFDESVLKHGSNVIGAIVVTLTTICVIKGVFLLRDKIHSSNNVILKRLKHGTSPWMTSALGAIIILVGIVFVFGAPLSYVSDQITWAFVEYGSEHWWVRFLIGGAFGMLVASDLGGIINKMALITLIGFAQYDLKFAAIIATAIPAASIGFGASFNAFKKKFKKEDVADGEASFRKGLNGMTEGPLFTTNKYGPRVIIPNLLGTFVASGLAMVIGLYIFKGGHIGILFIGGQADLSHANDIWWLAKLLPVGEGWLTAFYSILYGIIGYYLVMTLSVATYVMVSRITFSIPGEKKVFK